jgi:hypothetical protein
MFRRALLPGLLIVVASAFSPSSVSAANVRLVGSVGPGSAISVQTVLGVPVKSVKAGTYDSVVRDRSSRHNFRIAGPAGSIARATGVGFVGSVTWKGVILLPGTYRFWCGQHPRLKGSFRVS